MLTNFSSAALLALIGSVTALITPRLLTAAVGINTMIFNLAHFMGTANFL